VRHTFQRNHEAAQCEFGFGESRQVIVRVTGVLTPTSAGLVAAQLDRIASGVLAKAVLVDLSKALVALSEEQLNATPQTLPYATRVLPIAILPPPGVMELFKEHSWHAAKLGLLRGAFAEPGQAQEWLGRKAAARGLYSRTPVFAR
jgi:hypothetical protein